MLGQDDIKQLEFSACRVWGADDRRTRYTRGLDIGPPNDLGHGPADLVGIPPVMDHQGFSPGFQVLEGRQMVTRGWIRGVRAQDLVHILEPAPAAVGEPALEQGVHQGELIAVVPEVLAFVDHQ